MKAFIGDPADEHGNAVPCHYCDRRARGPRIGPRGTAIPLCDRHKPDGSLYATALTEARAGRRTRARLRGLV